MTTKLKLNKKQKRIVYLMQIGYKFQEMYSKPTLFKNGYTQYVPYKTVEQLRDLGLLSIDDHDPTKHKFHLTNEGTNIKISQAETI